MSSTNPFFRFRGRFDFSPSRFEIGNPIIQNKVQADNFFLKKLYQLSEDEVEHFYHFHLSYFLASHRNQEETFFKHVYDVVINRIKHFKRLDPFSQKYSRALESTRKLEAFLTFLKSIDQWHKTEPIESVIGDKDNQINKLKLRIAELEGQLKEAVKFDTPEKVLIDKGALPVFMDLFDQMKDLRLPNGNKLARSQTQSPWYKMIAKYFMHGDKEISIDTARNYFPAKKGDKPAKFIEIAEKDKLFKIIRKGDK
ncbi:MAG TPA: hypothetical protein VGI43_12910 [Mucilaginibacter sp.]|jgi:hypothetical protein